MRLLLDDWCSRGNTVKVFISWSGDTSKEIGSILRKFLPLILQDVDAFMSRHDIESGARWAERIQQELEQSSYGLIILTRSNLNAKWLLFEAGAISKLRNSATACLLCGGLDDTEVTGPLAQFQFQKFEQSSFFQLVRDMNNRIAKPLKEGAIDLVLAKWWPDIEAEYSAAIKQFASQETEEKNPRNEREFQDEILRMLQIAVKPNKPVVSKSGATVTKEILNSVTFENFWQTLSLQETEFLKSVVDVFFKFNDSTIERNRQLELRDQLRTMGCIMIVAPATTKSRAPIWRLSDAFRSFVRSKVVLQDV